MHPLLRLAPLFRPQLGLLGACMAGLCVATGLSLLGPWLVAQAIDRGISGGEGELLPRLALAYFAVVAGHMAITWVSRVGIEQVAQGAMFRLKQRLFDHLVGHDQAFHDRHPSGRLITRVQGDTQALQVLFAEVILATPADVALIVGILAMLLAVSPAIAALVFAVAPFWALALWIFRKKSPPLFLAEREVRAKLTGFLAEHVRAMPTLQRYDREAWARGRAEVLNGEVYRREIAESIARVLFFNSVILVRALGFALVLWAGAWLVMQGSLTVGVLVMGLGYLRQLFNPLMRVSHNLGTIERARAAAIRIAGIFDAEPTIGEPAAPVPWPGLAEAIRFEAVSFAYDPAAPVLTGLDLEVRAGSRVGIVGATGSGKSSLINLLLRFRDPQAGAVTIDGVDVRKIGLRDLRDHVGLVLQDVHLFPGTVLDNLGGDAEPAARALARLGIAIPLGAPVVADGSNLSRGERQLLTFARALVYDPEVLVLDEATSAVDPATEARVQAALETLQAGRTTLLVAHRLATVRDCDRIYVLSRGAVVEAGTHEELVARRGAYAALYQLQHGVAA